MLLPEMDAPGPRDPGTFRGATHSPSEDECRQIPCRFCTSPAAAVYYLDRGCFAAPEDREQALCVNHIMRATPFGGMDLVRVLLLDVLEGWRRWQGIVGPEESENDGGEKRCSGGAG